MKLNYAHSGFAGKSITEQLFDELLTYTQQLVDKSKLRKTIADGVDGEGLAGIDVEIQYLRGVCYGIAMSIATMKNPFGTDIDEIRNEVMIRLEDQDEESRAVQDSSY